MHDESKPMAKVCGKTRKSPSHRLAQCSNASRSVVQGGSLHGTGLADSAQSATGEQESSRSSSVDLEGFREAGNRDGFHKSQPRNEECLAPLGQQANQRRQSIHSQSQENVVKPQGRVSTENVLQLLKHQQYRCALTDRKLTPEFAALDHITPIRCDGQHVIENTQVLHKDVNRAKGSMTNGEFIRMCREVVNHTEDLKIEDVKK